jgi:hypothetical protein
MNKTIEENLAKKRNMLYYNQLVMNERKAYVDKHKKKISPKASFTSQKVDFKDFLFIPQNWEFAAYTFYIVAVPYLVGAIFLFFFVAGGSYENFKLLNMNAFVIIWMIGYEIVAVFSLIWILILYLQYDADETY